MSASIETEIETEVEDWECLFGAALLEQDYEKLLQRIANAETAIVICAERLDLFQDSCKAKALMEALITLHDLRTLVHT